MEDRGYPSLKSDVEFITGVESSLGDYSTECVRTLLDDRLP